MSAPENEPAEEYPGTVDSPEGESLARCGFVCDLAVSGGAYFCSGAGRNCPVQ